MSLVETAGAFEVELLGFTELAKKLRLAPKIFDKWTEIALRRATLLVLRDAKKDAPVHGGHRSFSPGKKAAGRQGGTLRRSIIQEVEKIGAFVWQGTVGPTVDYGKYVELGTDKMAARPYLYPALDRNREAIERIFRECYNEAIQELIAA